MPTKFFIGGNEFYDEEKHAQKVLEDFIEEYNLPPDLFVVVKINKLDS